MRAHVLHSLHEARASLDALLANAGAIDALTRAGEALVDTFRRGRRVFSCGNGGSMCDAMHFAEELSGRYRHDRKGLPAVAISDPGHISCVANDYGYAHVFSRYVESHGQAGDCLVGISTSGRSENVIRAARAARELGMVVIAVAGLLARSLYNLKTLDAGFNGDRVLLFTLDTYGTALDALGRAAIFADMVERLRTLPGAASVAASRSQPTSPSSAMPIASTTVRSTRGT